MSVESLFGGDFLRATADVERLQFPQVPGVALPAEHTDEMFRLCWDRFHYLKELGIAAVGQSTDLPSELRPQHAPYIVSLHFGTMPANIYRGLINLLHQDLDSNGRASVPPSLWQALPPEMLQVSWAGLTASHFFVEADLASAILAMRPPEPDLLADLRLPLRCIVIVLGAGFEISPDSGWWTEADVKAAVAHEDWSVDLIDKIGAPQWDEESSHLNMRGHSLERAFLEHGGHIRGVMLAADEHGFLEDHVTWLVTADDSHPSGELSGIVNGKLSQSTLAPIVYNLAASVAWGDWIPPEFSPAIPQTNDEFKSHRNGAFRRALRNPSNLGIHVIDVKKTTARARTASTPTGRTMSPHMRKGHWRSVRVATRDEHDAIIGDVHGEPGVEWHYEGRAILPTLVNAASIHEIDGVRVYRIADRATFEKETL